MEVAFSIQYHPLVVRDDIPSLDKAVRTKVKSAILSKLTVAPSVFGLPLRHSLKGHWKLRVGEYRVVYRIEGATVRIIAILHRSVVYIQLEKRI